MKANKDGRIGQYAFALLFGILGGLALWFWGAPNSSHIIPQAKEPAQVAAIDEAPPLTISEAATPAMKYAEAVEFADCATIIEQVWWIQERLQYVQNTTGDETALEIEKKAICQTLQTRPAEGNQLTSEGIEDKYVFRPGAEVTVAAVDGGRDDLARPAAERTWFRVQYPSPANAPRDRDGLAIRALKAGVNVTQDGYILKAGVQGNLELDWESISTEWNSTGE